MINKVEFINFPPSNNRISKSLTIRNANIRVIGLHNYVSLSFYPYPNTSTTIISDFVSAVCPATRLWQESHSCNTL